MQKGDVDVSPKVVGDRMTTRSKYFPLSVLCDEPSKHCLGLKNKIKDEILKNELKVCSVSYSREAQSGRKNKQDRFTQQNKLADIHAQLNSWSLIKVLLEARS